MVQMLLVRRSSCRAFSNSPSSSWPRYLWADGPLRLARPRREAGLGHAPRAGPSAPTPQRTPSFVIKPYVLPTQPGHHLKLPGHRAEGLDSASHISCGSCDSGQVTTLSGLTSFISMMCLDHISDFLSFSQRILLLNPTVPGIPGCKMGKGQAAPGSRQPPETPPKR